MPKVETAQKLPIFCVYAFLCVLNIVLYLFYSFSPYCCRKKCMQKARQCSLARKRDNRLGDKGNCEST